MPRGRCGHRATQEVRFPRRGSTPCVGLFSGWLFILFFIELDYTNKSLIDKQMCSGEGVLTSRSWTQVVREGEA